MAKPQPPWSTVLLNTASITVLLFGLVGTFGLGVTDIGFGIAAAVGAVLAALFLFANASIIDRLEAINRTLAENPPESQRAARAEPRFSNSEG